MVYGLGVQEFIIILVALVTFFFARGCDRRCRLDDSEAASQTFNYCHESMRTLHAAHS